MLRHYREMKSIKKELLVPYSASNMFNLVNDLERYPEFLPWCNKATILQSSENLMIGAIELKYAAFNQSFTTKNTLVAPHKITMNLVDGPFKHFFGEWTFTDISAEGSKVEFLLQFEFQNALLGLAFNKVFEGIANEMITHFYQRAQKIYG